MSTKHKPRSADSGTASHPMSNAVAFSRHWAMPSRETFSVKPIGQFVQKYLKESKRSVDPFARNNQWATDTNDINPATTAQCHMDAEEFLKRCAQFGFAYDLAILDPPYSPRQISDCYREIGRHPTAVDTQNATLYARVRRALRPLLLPGAVVLSFGWNSTGMGKGFDLIEVMLVSHGGAHNDTICIAERRCD